jgi:hypothetical protein
MSYEGGPTAYLLECYWPGVSEQTLVAAVERVQAAIEQRQRDRHMPRFLGSILVPADETVFCLFEGEQDEIEAVSTASDLPFARILSSRWIEGSRR